MKQAYFRRQWEGTWHFCVNCPDGPNDKWVNLEFSDSQPPRKEICKTCSTLHSCGHIQLLKVREQRKYSPVLAGLLTLGTVLLGVLWLIVIRAL